MEWFETLINWFLRNPVIIIIIFCFLFGLSSAFLANDQIKQQPNLGYDPLVRTFLGWIFLFVLLICFKLYFPDGIQYIFSM